MANCTFLSFCYHLCIKSNTEPCTPPVMLHFAPCAERIMAEVSEFLYHMEELSREAIFVDGTEIEACQETVYLRKPESLLHLSPLSQSEIMEQPAETPFSLDLALLSKRQKDHTMLDTPEIFQRIHLGGMPALVTGTYANTGVFYSSYIDTYMERDVRRLSNDIDSLKFLRFLRSAAARASQQVNYKGIADDAEIDQTTAKNWLHVLEALGIIFLLEPYSNNVLKRTVSTPKLYFYDSGLVCYLTRWSSPETAMEGAMSGTFLENYVVAEIIKTYQNAGQEPFLYYYRDKDVREIDLILERDGKLFPIEIKKMASPPQKLTKVFDLIDKSPLQRSTSAILCMADQLGAFDKDNLIVPIFLI